MAGVGQTSYYESNTPVVGYTFGQALASVGLLPEGCTDVEILTSADAAMAIRYTVLLRAEDLPKMAEAFALMSKDVTPKGRSCP